MEMDETGTEERKTAIKTRTWRQVGRVLEQMIARYVEEIADLEIKLERLDEDSNIREQTMEQIRKRYYIRIYEVLEKYHAMRTAHELMFSLFNEPHALMEQGFVIPDMNDIDGEPE